MSSKENGTTLNAKTPESEKSKPLLDSKKEKPRRGYFRWSLALIVRLFIWYTVLTPFLHCPSDISGLNESSPRVCKPYLIAREYIDPHVNHYYQAYAASYVDRAQPYVSAFNEHVYVPSSKVVKHGYQTYGAPALAQVSEYSQDKWDSVAVPQLKSIQARAAAVYRETLEPYVQQVTHIVTPYIDTVSSLAANTYNEHILPLYNRSKPFLIRVYSSSQNVLFETVLPRARQGWLSLSVFVKGNLIPAITGLYSQNVEPQLIKIGERLASYREGEKLRTVVDEYEGSTELPVTGTTASMSAASVSETQTTNSPTPTTESAQTRASLTPEQQIENARRQVASDLLVWQQKFAVAADNGVDDLGERVKQIVNSQLSGAKGHGESLIEALETVHNLEVSKIKEHINSIISELPVYDAPEEERKADEDLLQFIRLSGGTIRDRAHSIREWYNGFEQELVRRVTAAANSTLEVLDGVRDLGLQEIGMRWAWMDGVTYKDWTKYHTLRKQFDEWKGEVLAAGLQHEKVEEAKAIANDILSRGMATAEDAAKELSRLKEVGKWKIQAREINEDFETRSEPPPPLAKPEEDSIEESESTLDSDAEAFTENSETETDDADEPVAIFEDIEPSDSETTTVRIELAKSTPEPSTRNQPVDDSNETSEFEEFIPEQKDDQEEDNVSVTDNTVWGGVAAQAVTHQIPVFDDDDDDDQTKFTEYLNKLISEASERHTEATKAVNEALFAQLSNPSFPEQLLSTAHDQYSRALEAASSALYGTLSTDEQAAPPASEKYEKAIAAASSVFYNHVPGSHSTSSALQSISSVAFSHLQQGLNAASAELSSLKATIAPTPTGIQNPIFLDAQRRYYEAVGLAHDRYSVFVSSASDVIFEGPSPTPTPTPIDPQSLLEDAISQYHQVSGLASSSLGAVIASASAAGHSGDSARGIIDDALSKYSNAMVAASASLSVASESASSAIYGTPTESITSQASDRWHSMISHASEQIYGTPTSVAQLYEDQEASNSSTDESAPAESAQAHSESYSSIPSSETSDVKDEL